MLDISFSELLLCFLVALVVLGPEKLPRVARGSLVLREDSARELVEERDVRSVVVGVARLATQRGRGRRAARPRAAAARAARLEHPRDGRAHLVCAARARGRARGAQVLARARVA